MSVTLKFAWKQICGKSCWSGVGWLPQLHWPSLNRHRNEMMTNLRDVYQLLSLREENLFGILPKAAEGGWLDGWNTWCCGWMYISCLLCLNYTHTSVFPPRLSSFIKCTIEPMSLLVNLKFHRVCSNETNEAKWVVNTTSFASTGTLYLHVTIHNVIFFVLFGLGCCNCQWIGLICKQRKVSVPSCHLGNRSKWKANICCNAWGFMIIAFLNPFTRTKSQHQTSWFATSGYVEQLVFVAHLDCFVSSF